MFQPFLCRIGTLSYRVCTYSPKEIVRQCLSPQKRLPSQSSAGMGWNWVWSRARVIPRARNKSVEGPVIEAGSELSHDEPERRSARFWWSVMCGYRL